jgi:hypothetical protein
MLLYLVNPANTLVSMSLSRGSFWNRFRLWKPLGLLVLAGLTHSDWEISILDENLGPVDYDALPRPDLVGITAHLASSPGLRDRRALSGRRHPGGHGRYPRHHALGRSEPLRRFGGDRRS